MDFSGSMSDDLTTVQRISSDIGERSSTTEGAALLSVCQSVDVLCMYAYIRCMHESVHLHVSYRPYSTTFSAADTISSITNDFQLGFGSFIDKPVTPFFSASQLK